MKTHFEILLNSNVIIYNYNLQGIPSYRLPIVMNKILTLAVQFQLQRFFKVVLHHTKIHVLIDIF